MALADELKVGDHVVVRGLGLGKVKSRKADGLLVRLASDDDTAEIGAGKIDALVRRPMSAGEAREVLEVLSRKDGDPDPRPWGEQYIELQRVRKAGAPKEQAALLQKLYRVRGPSSAQQRMLEAYEEALLGELAHSLKEKIGPIRTRVHHGQPAFGYQAPERDDEGPIEPLAAVPAGWKVEAAFRVFSRMMAIGELPTSARDGELPTSDGDEVRDDCRLTLVIPCEGGDWFALRREDDEGGWEFAIVSREHAPHVADLLGFAVRLGAVEVEGGTVHVVDEEVRDDRRYQHGMGHGVGDILGRGFSANVGGDGDTEIFGTRKQGTERYVLFHIKA